MFGLSPDERHDLEIVLRLVAMHVIGVVLPFFIAPIVVLGVIIACAQGFVSDTLRRNEQLQGG